MRLKSPSTMFWMGSYNSNSAPGAAQYSYWSRAKLNRLPYFFWLNFEQWVELPYMLIPLLSYFICFKLCIAPLLPLFCCMKFFLCTRFMHVLWFAILFYGFRPFCFFCIILSWCALSVCWLPAKLDNRPLYITFSYFSSFGLEFEELFFLYYPS